MINDVLRDLLDRGVIAYLDDILIYSETEEEHIALVSEVLRRLQDYGLAVTLDKCCFHEKEVDFLGYVVSDKGFSMAADKVDSIRQWKSPKNVKDVQTFVGFANFYRRFIKGFSAVVAPITDPLKQGGRNFELSMRCELAFRKLKHMFTSAPILR